MVVSNSFPVNLATLGFYAMPLKRETESCATHAVVAGDVRCDSGRFSLFADTSADGTAKG